MKREQQKGSEKKERTNQHKQIAKIIKTTITVGHGVCLTIQQNNSIEKNRVEKKRGLTSLKKYTITREKIKKCGDGEGEAKHVPIVN